MIYNPNWLLGCSGRNKLSYSRTVATHVSHPKVTFFHQWPIWECKIAIMSLPIKTAFNFGSKTYPFHQFIDIYRAKGGAFFITGSPCPTVLVDFSNFMREQENFYFIFQPSSYLHTPCYWMHMILLVTIHNHWTEYNSSTYVITMCIKYDTEILFKELFYLYVGRVAAMNRWQVYLQILKSHMGSLYLLRIYPFRRKITLILVVNFVETAHTYFSQNLSLFTFSFYLEHLCSHSQQTQLIDIWWPHVHGRDT